MNNFKLELTENEVNILLQSLAKQPFEVVAGVIKKIQEQAQGQLKQEENDTDTTD